MYFATITFSHIPQVSFFYQYMVVFLFNTVIYVFLLYVFLLLSLYSYCSSMYSYHCLCILTVIHVFLDAATLTEVFPCFFLSLKSKCQGITSQDGARPALFQNCCVFLCIVCFVSFYVLFVCKCILYYCHRVTTQLQLTNISYRHIVFQPRVLSETMVEINISRCLHCAFCSV